MVSFPRNFGEFSGTLIHSTVFGSQNNSVGRDSVNAGEFSNIRFRVNSLIVVTHGNLTFIVGETTSSDLPIIDSDRNTSIGGTDGFYFLIEQQIVMEVSSSSDRQEEERHHISSFHFLLLEIAVCQWHCQLEQLHCF
jgi:hypothetical protein